MKAGFLGLETNPDNNSHHNAKNYLSRNPELIKVVIWNENPATEKNHYPSNIKYVARFNDILAAEMHFHSGLRKQLHDINTHTYQANLSDAIAVIEANDDLRHERIWIDPEISDRTLEAIQSKAVQKRRRNKTINRIIQLVGIAALGLLALRFIGSVL